MRRPFFLASLLAAACLAAAPVAVCAQAVPQVPAPSQVVPPSTLVQAALSNVQSTTSGLDIARWQAPRDARKVAQQNVDSIQRDLGIQMPALVARADGAPDSVPRSFDLYRNIDALYDVLLRISRTADATAPPDEANALAASLGQLEQARSALGDQILQVARAHQTRLATLEHTAAAANAEPEPAATAAPPRETVITDGPVGTSRYRVRRHTTRHTAAKPSPDVPAKPNNQP